MRPGKSGVRLLGRALLAVLLVLLVVLAGAALRARAAGAAGAGRSVAVPSWAPASPPPAQMFAALLAAEPRVRVVGGRPQLMLRYPEDYARAEALADHFTGAARVGGRRVPAPAGEAEARQRAYAEVAAPPEWPPLFARWALEYTVGRSARVLDVAAGWGGRLAGAIAAGATYEGYGAPPAAVAGLEALAADLGGGAGQHRVAAAEYPGPAAGATAYDVALVALDPAALGAGPRGLRRAARTLLRAAAAVRPGGWVLASGGAWGGPGDAQNTPLRRVAIGALAARGERHSDLGCAPGGAPPWWTITFRIALPGPAA